MAVIAIIANFAADFKEKDQKSILDDVSRIVQTTRQLSKNQQHTFGRLSIYTITIPILL